MREQMESGYKGYHLAKTEHHGTYDLFAPSGIHVACLVITFDGDEWQTAVDGLDCGRGHKTREHGLKYVVRQYELLTTTRWERFSNRVSRFLAHGGWSAVAAVAAILAAILSALTFIVTVGKSVSPYLYLD